MLLLSDDLVLKLALKTSIWFPRGHLRRTDEKPTRAQVFMSEG